MNRLVNFLKNNGHWLLLLLFEAIALSLLFNGSLYHRFIRTTFSNKVVGSVQNISGEVKSYLSLKEKNKLLTEQLAQAELNYLHLKQQIDFSLADTITPYIKLSDSLSTTSPLTFVTAEVISSSISHRKNLVLLNKGKRDGIKEQMGVVSATGIAGIISSVRENYSVMVPLLNPDLRLSCLIKRTGYSGTLSWNDPGNTYARLDELSSHSIYKKGDTVVTSGYSLVFPQGLFVGTIAEGKRQNDEVAASSSSILVKLGTDFDRLQFVYIITGGFVVSSSEADSIFQEGGVR